MAVESRQNLGDVVAQLQDVQQALYDGYDELYTLIEKWEKDADLSHSETALARTVKVIGLLLTVRKMGIETRHPLALNSEVFAILATVSTRLETALKGAVELQQKRHSMTEEELDSQYIEHPIEVLWDAWQHAVDDDCENLEVELLALEVSYLKDVVSGKDISPPPWLSHTDLTDTEENILTALGKETLKGQDLLKRAGYDYSSHYRQILSNLCKLGVLRRSVQGYCNPRSTQ